MIPDHIPARGETVRSNEMTDQVLSEMKKEYRLKIASAKYPSLVIPSKADRLKYE